MEQSYRLELDGRPAPPELLDAVQSLDVEDHVDLAGIVRLRIGVAVASSGDAWSFVDEDMFPRLGRVRVQARVGNAQATLVDAHVVEVRAALDGEPSRSFLDVVAMDATAVMNLEERVRAWPGRSDADVAREVFGEHGLDADVEDTQPVWDEADSTLMQRGTDIRFLRGLARRNGFECYVETDPVTDRPTGHFHPPRLDGPPQGILTVGMGAPTVDHFTVRHHMVGVADAEAHGVDAATLEVQDGAAEGSSLKSLGRDEAGKAGRRRVIVDAGGATEQVETVSQAMRDRTGWAVAAEGRLNTALYGKVLRAKRNVLVRGVGRRFGGTYRVERVLHTFTEEGHVQHFTLRRNALGLDTKKFVDREAGR